MHTELVDCVSTEEAAKFNMYLYLNMSNEGDYVISDRLQSAIERAEAWTGLCPKLAWPPQVGSYLTVCTCGREPSWESRYTGRDTTVR